MSAPFERLAELDRLVHEPARLAILTALSACERADFLYLQRLTGLSRGNLSSHLSKLEAAGLIAIEKEFVGKIPTTRVEPTRDGRAAIAPLETARNLRQATLEIQTLREDAGRETAAETGRTGNGKRGTGNVEPSGCSARAERHPEGVRFLPFSRLPVVQPSARSASIGSMRAARIAGSQLATAATASRPTLPRRVSADRAARCRRAVS